MQSPAQSAPDLSAYRTIATAIRAVPATAPSGRAGRTGYLGVEVSLANGTLVITTIESQSPAALGGLEVGDAILSIAGNTVRSAEDLRQTVQAAAPGESIAVRIERRGKPIDLAVTLGATSRPLRLGQARASLGIQPGDPRQNQGTHILKILPNLPAASAGLCAGDTILAIDGTPLDGATSVNDALAASEIGQTVCLTILREGRRRQVKLELAAEPPPKPARPAARPSSRPATLPATTQTTSSTTRPSWPESNVYRLAVIGVEFPDAKPNPLITKADWEESIFSRGTYRRANGPTSRPVYGSFNDYFLEVSCGALKIEGKVFDWIALDKKRADYADPPNRGVFLNEALERFFARYGADALDSYDGLCFLIAGTRYPTGLRNSIFWPHRNVHTYKGKKYSYFTGPEGGNQMTSISTPCHEFGHMLGLPDLYARPENPGSEGMGQWCAMSLQISGGRPQHYSAWCKERLGWLKPAVIDPRVKQKLILSPVENSPTECFKVLVRADGSEYLLLENRRKIGFDQGLPGEGLLIWRVVQTRPVLEESHGIEGPPGPSAFPACVPYPSAANNAFTPYTTPASRSMLGGGLPVHITSIRQLPDGRVTFHIGYELQ